MKQAMYGLLCAGLLYPAAASGTFTGVVPRVYYYSNHQVQELWWDSIANQWHARAVGQEANAPQISDPLALPAGFATGVALDPRVYYVTANTTSARLEVEELAWNRTANTWAARDLSQELNAPGVNLQNRGLTAFGTGVNLDPRVYYVDASNHVEELSWYGNQWHVRDISQETGVQVSYCPIAFGVGTNLDPRVYCVDAANHVRELSWVSNAWHVRDLSQQFGAPLPGGNLVGFGVGSDLDPRIYYMSANGHIQELAWFSSTWHLRDVSQLVTAPTNAGTELLVGFGVGAALDPRVYYVDDQRQIDELAWFSTDQLWHVYAASSAGAVPLASFGAGTAVGTGLDPRLYYFGPNHQVREVAGSSQEAAPWTGRYVGEEGNATPADSIGRLLAFAVGGPTVRLDTGNFQTIVDQNPPGTTFIVTAGQHRMQQIVPKDDDVFIGERDSNGNLLSSLNGSRLFPKDAWTRAAAGYWVASLGLPGFERGIRHGQCSGSGSVIDSISNDLPCIFPESLFRDDAFVKRVSHLEDVSASADTWYFDYATNRIYVGRNPGGHKMEIGVTPFALGYTVTLGGEYLPVRLPASDGSQCDPFALDQAGKSYGNYPSTDCGEPLPNPNFPSAYDTYKPARITVKNLIVEKYANPAQTGAIGYFRPGLDWQILNNEVRLNHGSGIKFKGKALVEGNSAHDNGDFGIEAGDGNTQASDGGHLSGADEYASFNGLPEWGYWGGYAGTGAIVANNTMSRNNVVLAYSGGDMRMDSGWGAGGTKFSQAENLLIVGNAAENNAGPGLWADFSYDGLTYIGNLVRYNSNNSAGALLHEVSGAADIACNVVDNNIFTSSAPPRSAQIFISNSHRVNVRLNEVTVSNIRNIGGNGITVEDAGYRTNEELPAYAFQDSVLRNSITFRGPDGVTGLSGTVSDVITEASVVLQHLATVTFDFNSYHVPALNQSHWWGLEHPEMPDDIDAGQINFAAFQGLGQESHGTVDRNPGALPADCAAIIAAAQQRVRSGH